MYNVLSLFDGISCGQVALHRAGIPINKYYASEIDQRAVKVTQRNWPKTIQFGDVTKIRKEHFMSPIDLLIGGSPCQGFSFAGKQLNFNDPRSKLFFEFVRLREELQPKYFFLENVRMAKESKDVISKYLGVEPVFVNSALVSAQNRQRLYWTNIPGFVMPEDKGVLIRDIIQDKVKVKYYLSKIVINKLVPSGTNQDKLIKILFHNKSFRRNNQVFDSNGKTEAIDTSQGGGRVQSVMTSAGPRYFTPNEYERLQGIKDDYTFGSDSARYHALGNGWQVDTIVEFFKNIPH